MHQLMLAFGVLHGIQARNAAAILPASNIFF
jgi:hypothetical protein